MQLKKRYGVALLCVFLFSPALLSAVSPEELADALVVARKVSDRYVGDDSRIYSTMRLKNRNGDVRERKMVRHYLKIRGLEKTIVTFLHPADIKDTSLLTWQNVEGPDTQFIYLPAMKKTRRVASSDKRKSFMGSDLNYEDMGKSKAEDFNYSSLSTQLLDGQEFYFYEASPRTPDKSVYGKTRSWVRKDNFIPYRVEYFDKFGKLFKIGIFTDINSLQGIPTVCHFTMENIEESHATEMIVQKDRSAYNLGLTEGQFTLRALGGGE